MQGLDDIPDVILFENMVQERDCGNKQQKGKDRHESVEYFSEQSEMKMELL